MEYQLVLDRVTKQYGPKIACDRISLQAGPGVYGLLGANGAGKTTLLRMICGVLRPTSGDIRFAGLDVSSEGYRARLGYLPQDFGYYPEFTALDFLLYLAALKGLPRAAARQQSRDLLELVGLTGEAGHRIRTFSGGMRQRLGIAQALLGDPQLLVLDEPTAGLDPKERVRFRNLIARLGARRTVLLSTHIVSDVEHIAGTILILKSGVLLQSGPRDAVLQAVQGKVWTCTLPPAEAEALCARYPAADTCPAGEKVALRLLADACPCPGAQPAEPTLEDLYLYHFSEVSEA
ncbi:MAG TPA: ABC transporter ATP-binding protein [Candidatus Gemmiger stercoravium]|uniref:ABC transporter ATP-binding protein n=1 Tax=uncultured Subdoligranulum sp. TaxID=512298 RepID=UPI001F84FF6D|nr:ABC transporter ATP-binding protein [uncultured Subdoligranulum sp.]HJC55227.1 ABC transporter ATP-binding protein [Candidatus Gemmiger stercoravium]